MRKSSSDSSQSKRSGSNSTFNNNGGGRDAKPYKKKNYDGRGSSESTGGKPSRSASPYSGRTPDGDKSGGRPFEKRGSFDDRKPRGESPFSDRKRDGDKKPFEKRGSFDDRKPRGERPFSDRKQDGDKKPFEKRGSFDDRKPRGERPFSDRKQDGDKKPFEKRGSFDDRKPRGERPFSDRKQDGDKKPFEKRGSFDDRKPRGDRPFSDRKQDGDKKPFEKRGSFDDRKPRGERPFSDRKQDGDKKPFEKRGSFDKPAFKKDDKNKGKPFRKAGKPADSRPFRERQKEQHVEKIEIPDEVSFSKDIDDVLPGKYNTPPADTKPYNKAKRLPSDKKEQSEQQPFTPSGKKKHYHNHDDDDDDYEDEEKEINQTNGPRLEMPLNKFIAHSGECSRRDAAELVKQGKVKVNGELVLDPGYRVQHDDKVTMSGKKLTPQKGMVYLLLNKPKGFITTNEDPQGRKTVMQLVGNSGIERLFPVGRLDKDTSGLLLITNDGDLTQKLCHPSYNIKKVYQVTLDKPLTKADFEKIIEGVELEDGKAIVDELAYLEKKNELGLEIHSGRNRIVRRIFESLGYVVEKLDRMMYAGLTKKNLPRGKWRFLDPREVVLLKHFKS